MQNNQHIKRKTARLSIYSNTLLILVKLTGGFLSGSVSIISEAIHSGLDLVASLIAFLAVRISDKPPDEEHPFGHGKFENVSGVVESLLIFAAAIWIIVEAVHHILSGGNMLEDNGILLGVGIMLFSAVINFFVSRKLYRVARKTGSVALEADALHLKTDIYTSLGVSAGLGIMYLTGWHLLDSLIAIAVALFILYEAYQMLVKSFQPLIDSTIPKKDLELIKTRINQNMDKGFRCKALKTRMSGHKQILELTLKVPGDMTVAEASQKAENLKKRLLSQNPDAEVIVIFTAE